ncbi:Pentatricopeptide repeat-containing protein [Nymphaea thermarum]|nr:Pentatricopeptide repeat-containing protein [Nymphaea thermarum]
MAMMMMGSSPCGFENVTRQRFQAAAHVRPPPLLHLLRRCSSPEDLSRIHALVVKVGPPPHLTSHLLKAAVEVESATLRLPSSLFARISRPDISAFNVMVRGYAQSESPLKALLLYLTMLETSVVPDRHTFLFIIKACGRLNLLQEAMAVHGHVVKAGFSCDVFVLTALVHAYAIVGRLESARQLFDQMPERNVVSWNALISGYCRVGRVGDARKLFDEMPVQKTLASWNAIIAGYVQNELYRKALMVLNDMQCKKVKMDVVTVISALSACASLGALTIGEWLHKYVARIFKCYVISWNPVSGQLIGEELQERMSRAKTLTEGHDKRLALGNALISMYSKCGDINKGLLVFEAMPVKNVISWTSIIDGCALHGEGRRALNLFDRMKTVVIPNAVTYVAVLRACSHSGLVNEGMLHFDEMLTEYGIKPQVEHYGCMVDLFCRAGMLDAAYEFTMGMPVQPDVVTWRNLLCGCRTHGDHQLGRIVADHILQRGLQEEEGLCVLISSIYAAGGRWEDAAYVRKKMKKSGIRKTPGCSSIEVDNMVHEFVKGDKSHPKTREIYDMIADMMKNLRYSENCSPNFFD